MIKVNRILPPSNMAVAGAVGGGRQAIIFLRFAANHHRHNGSPVLQPMLAGVAYASARRTFPLARASHPNLASSSLVTH